MKIKIKENNVKEIEIPNGYYKYLYECFSINGDRVISVFILGDYVSMKTDVSEYSDVYKATPITKDEFDAQLEIAFEIIRGKLNNDCHQCAGTGNMDEVIKESFASDRVSPRYKKVACNKCQED